MVFFPLATLASAGLQAYARSKKPKPKKEEIIKPISRTVGRTTPLSLFEAPKKEGPIKPITFLDRLKGKPATPTKQKTSDIFRERGKEPPGWMVRREKEKEQRRAEKELEKMRLEAVRKVEEKTGGWQTAKQAGYGVKQMGLGLASGALAVPRGYSEAGTMLMETFAKILPQPEPSKIPQKTKAPSWVKSILTSKPFVAFYKSTGGKFADNAAGKQLAEAFEGMPRIVDITGGRRYSLEDTLLEYAEEAGSHIYNKTIAAMSSGVVQVVPGVAAAFIPHGIPAYIGTLLGAEAGGIYQEATDSGVPALPAFGIAAAFMGPSYVAERFSMNKIVGDKILKKPAIKYFGDYFLNVSKKSGKRILTGAGTEVWTEELQTTWENTLARHTYDEARGYLDGWYEALVGAMAGGGVGTTIAVGTEAYLSSKTRRRIIRDVQKKSDVSREEATKFVDAMAQVAEASFLPHDEMQKKLFKEGQPIGEQRPAGLRGPEGKGEPKKPIDLPKARKAKGKVVYTPKEVTDGRKGADSKVAEIYGGKWTNRDNGYLIPETRQEEFKTALGLVEQGKITDVPYLFGGKEDRVAASDFRKKVKELSEKPVEPKAVPLSTPKLEPIAPKVLYRETSVQGVRDLFNRQGLWEKRFFDENIDLALGQGESKGVIVKVKGDVAWERTKKGGSERLVSGIDPKSDIESVFVPVSFKKTAEGKKFLFTLQQEGFDVAGAKKAYAGVTKKGDVFLEVKKKPAVEPIPAAPKPVLPAVGKPATEPLLIPTKEKPYTIGEGFAVTEPITRGAKPAALVSSEIEEYQRKKGIVKPMTPEAVRKVKVRGFIQGRKDTRAELLAEFKDKKKSVEQKQDALNKYIQENLGKYAPKSFVTMVKNTKTQKQLDNAMKKVDKEIDKNARELILDRLDKFKDPSISIFVEQQKEIREALSVLEDESMTKEGGMVKDRSVFSVQELDDLLATVQQLEAEGKAIRSSIDEKMATEVEASVAAIADYKYIRNMDINFLERIKTQADLDKILVKVEAEIKTKIEGDVERLSLAELPAVVAIHRAEATKTHSETRNEMVDKFEDEKSTIKEKKEAFKDYVRKNLGEGHLERLSNMEAEIGKKLSYFESKRNAIYAAASTARDIHQFCLLSAIMFESADGARGLENPGALTKEIADPLYAAQWRASQRAKPYEDRVVRYVNKYKKEGGINKREAQMIEAYAVSQQKGRRAWLEDYYSRAEVAEAIKTVEGSEKLMGYYEMGREIFDELYPVLNEASKLYKNKEIPRIDNYWTLYSHMVESSDQIGEIITRTHKKVTAEPDPTKRRKKTVRKPVLNAKIGLLKYINDVFYFTEVEGALQKANSIVKTPEVKAKMGNKMFKFTTGWIDTMARQGYTPSSNSTFNKALRYFRKGATIMMIFFKFSTVGRQGLALATSVGHLGTRVVENVSRVTADTMSDDAFNDILGGLSESERIKAEKFIPFRESLQNVNKSVFDKIAAKHRKDKPWAAPLTMNMDQLIKFALKASPKLRKRLMGELDVQNVLGDKPEGKIGRAYYETVEAGAWAMVKVDGKIATGAWLTAYENYLRDHNLRFDPKKVNCEAALFAQKMVGVTNATTDFSDLPKALQNEQKEVWRAFFHLQTHMMEVEYGNWFELMPQMLKRNKKKGGKLLTLLMIEIFVSMMITSWMLEKIRGKEEKDPMILRLMDEFAAKYPIISKPWGMYRYDGDVATIIGASRGLVEGTVGVFTNENKTAKMRSGLTALENSGVLTHFPTKQPAQFIKDWHFPYLGTTPEKVAFAERKLAGKTGEEYDDKLIDLYEAGGMSQTVRMALELRKTTTEEDVSDELWDIVYTSDKDTKLEMIIELLADEKTVSNRLDLFDQMDEIGVFKRVSKRKTQGTKGTTDYKSEQDIVNELIAELEAIDDIKKEDRLTKLNQAYGILNDKEDFAGFEEIVEDSELQKMVLSDPEFKLLMK